MEKKKIRLALAIGIGIILAVFMITNSEKRQEDYTKEINDQQQTINRLQQELKQKTSDSLEKDIQLREKNDTIQQLYSQKEGLIWQLNGKENQEKNANE